MAAGFTTGRSRPSRSMCFARHYTRKLPSNYNRVAVSKKKLLFEHLLDEIQTAIASFAIQYGDNVNNSEEPARSYWALVTSQEFAAAASLLEKQPKHRIRRRKEASLLRTGLAKLMMRKVGQ